MSKSIKTIRDEAVPFVSGIKNLDVFIEEGNNNWNFHDSEIRSIRWNDKRRTLDVTVEPIGYAVTHPDDGPDKQALIDFHFKDVILRCFLLTLQNYNPRPQPFCAPTKNFIFS